MRFSAGPETPPVYCFISLGIIYDDAWCGSNKHQLSRALKIGSGWNDTCDETASTTARLPSCVTHSPKLQALVYDILFPTTAIIGYAIGLEELSAKARS